MIAGWCSSPDCNSPAHVEVNGKLYCYTHAEKATETRPITNRPRRDDARKTPGNR
jgi:hypothetical protein